MSDDERKALAWLDTMAAERDRSFAPARTLKAMLAAPRMPERDVHEAVDAAFGGHTGLLTREEQHLCRLVISRYHRALYAFLAAPKTKEVEVKAWAWMDGDRVVEITHDAQQAARWKMAVPVTELTGKAAVPA